MSESYIVRPMMPLRRVIAAPMTEANRTVPHYRVGVDIRMDTLLALREELNVAKPEVRISQ